MVKRYLIIFLVILSSCKKKNCENLSANFESYAVAKVELKKHKFKLQESLNSEQSSWIKSVEYLSCNGKTGFLILETDKQEYVHQDVPIEIWKEFSKVSSVGNFYNLRIKRKYQLSIQQ
jgi:KTSC domain